MRYRTAVRGDDSILEQAHNFLQDLRAALPGCRQAGQGTSPRGGKRVATQPCLLLEIAPCPASHWCGRIHALLEVRRQPEARDRDGPARRKPGRVSSAHLQRRAQTMASADYQAPPEQDVGDGAGEVECRHGTVDKHLAPIARGLQTRSAGFFFQFGTEEQPPLLPCAVEAPSSPGREGRSGQPHLHNLAGDGPADALEACIRALAPCGVGRQPAGKAN